MWRKSWSESYFGSTIFLLKSMLCYNYIDFWLSWVIFSIGWLKILLNLTLFLPGFHQILSLSYQSLRKFLSLLVRKNDMFFVLWLVFWLELTQIVVISFQKLFLHPYFLFNLFLVWNFILGSCIWWDFYYLVLIIHLLKRYFGTKLF